MNNILFDEATHIYRNATTGIIIPNITTIIKEIIGGGWQASEWHRHRGRVMHQCAVLIGQGKKFEYDPRIAGEIKALYSFFDDYKPEVYDQEIIVHSETHDFVGTLDIYCKTQGKKVIADWKHSLDKIRTPIQVGGYAEAARNKYGDINYGMGVELRSDGRYNTTGIFPIRKQKYDFLALNRAYHIKAECGKLNREEG